jgi:hypothetical protein
VEGRLIALTCQQKQIVDAEAFGDGARDWNRIPA